MLTAAAHNHTLKLFLIQCCSLEGTETEQTTVGIS